MKRFELINLSHAGVLEITNHDLSPAHAYKIVKFRKSLREALEAIDRDIEVVRKDVGITDPAAFDAELMELRKTEDRSPEQQARLDEMEATLRRFMELRAQLFEEEVTLDCKTIPYEQWHVLQNENRARMVNGKEMDVLSGHVEDVLEGVLWKAPEEVEG